MSMLDEDPTPVGTLILQTLAMPADTNPSGDIYAGWLMARMDLAGSTLAQNIASGRVTTVAVGSMVFLRPVSVGASISFYAEEVEVGRSSIRTRVEVWMQSSISDVPEKVTEGEFVFVAIDDNGRTRPIK